MSCPAQAVLAAALTLAALLCGCSGDAIGIGTTQTTLGAQAAGASNAYGLRPENVDVGSGLAAQQVLARSLEDSPTSLDPQLMTDVEALSVDTDLFEGLTRYAADGTIEPGIASSWQITPDGLTWTFHLRPTARWSNGAPLTAADFVYGWRREVNPATGAQYAEAFEPFVNGTAILNGRLPPSALGVETPDAHTLRLHLVVPAPYLLQQLAQPYMAPAYEPAIRRWGDGWIRPEHMVCDGAFVLAENVLGNRITLVKNPHYWDASSVHLARVTYYIISDAGQLVLRYLAGGVELTDVFPSAEYPYLKSRLGDQVVVAPEFATYMMSSNFAQGPLRSNRALRLALTMAIDRAALTRYIELGVNEPAYTLMPDLPGYDQPVPDWARLDKSQRDEEARRLYHEAGYSASHPLRIELDIPTSGPQTLHLFEAIVATWNSVLGADIGLHEEEFKVLLQDEQLKKLNLFYFSWQGDYLDPYTYLQIFQTGNTFNAGAYSNSKYDSLVNRAEHRTDAVQRYQLFARAEQLLNDDVAYIPLFYYADHHLIKRYVKGWKTNLQDLMPSRTLYVLQHQGG